MKPHRNTINIMEKYPLMRDYWDYENNSVDPTTLGSASKTEIHLKCPVGHRFVKSVSSFLSSPKCPGCYLEKNSIVAVKPEIIKWWDYEKNGDDRPERHTKAESIKVWWRCPKCTYSWCSEILSRMISKDQCPCCDLGIALQSGVNDAATRCPEILLDWDFENNDLQPEEIFLKEKRPVFWKCHICGYQWSSSLYGHIKRQPDGTYRLRKCKFCNDKVKVAGLNDFKALYPELAQEYIPELNSIPLEGLAPTSADKIFWRCNTCNQIFDCAPGSRVGAGRSGKGCPFCTHKRPIKGKNDLKTWCENNEQQALLLEWDFARNKKQPEDYYYKTSKSVHWKCNSNASHIWDASIADRILGRSKCPTCFKVKPRLKFSEAHPEMLKYWDYEKNEFGPDHYNEFSNESIFWKCDKGHSFEQLIFRFSSKGFYCIICENTQLVKQVNDLKTMYPEIAADWDYEKNKFPPEHYKINSNKKVWWLCPDGHPSYQRTIRERVLERDKNCPICMNTGVVAGINDALSHYPKLKKIWDYKGNVGKGPGEISFKYQRKIDCTCTKGHHWSEYLSALINADFTCAYCEDRKPLLGFNTLIDLYPDIAADWDYDDPHNQSVTPDSVTTTKGVQYAWVCQECGNTFLASIPDRVNNKKGCQYCKRVKVDPARTSFKALYPELASEFSGKNDYNPSNIFPSHCHPVRWDCHQCGMTWYGKIRDRISGISTCPYCNGELAIPGKTSLKALFPIEASEFRAKDGRDPDMVTPRYAVKVNWDCKECGLSWVSTVRDRIIDGEKCPYCSGDKAIPGKTSLKALYPNIAAEFFTEDGRDPDSILPDYGVRVQWNCKVCSQTWISTVKERIQDGFECPCCSGKRAIPGKTSFSAVFSELLDEWNFRANILNADPDLLLPSSTQMVWWQCPKCNHTYQARINDRVSSLVRNKDSCPKCKGYRRQKHHIL